MIDQGQAYSLVTGLACTGHVDIVLERVKNIDPKLVPDSRRFLNLYLKYCKGKLNRPGNGYADPAAFQKAYAIYSKGESGK